MQPPAATPSIVLLAGGASTRLGRDKRLAHVGGGPLVARVAAVAGGLGLPVFAAVARGDANVPVFAGVALLDEPPPAGGALPAVQHWLRAFDAELLVLAADLPLVSADLLRQLLDAAAAAPAALAVAAQTPGGLEPLCAVYRPALLPTLDAARAHGQQSLARLLALLPSPARITVDARPPQLLWNVNDREALQAARTLAGAQAPGMPLGNPTRAAG